MVKTFKAMGVRYAMLFPEKRAFFLALTLSLPVLLLFSFFSGPNLAGAQSPRPYFTDIGQFNYARFLSNGGEDRAAAREYARLIEEFPSSPLLPESHLRMSEAYLKAGLLKEAEENLKLFLSNFKDSPLVPEAGRLLEEASGRIREEGGYASAGPLSGRRMGEYGAVYEAPEQEDTGIRAVQVSLFEAESYPEIDAEMGRLKKSGINTVIVRVFHNEGDRFHGVVRKKNRVLSSGVYFRTEKAPVIEDLLTPIAAVARRNGLMVFAWMTTRYADYGLVERDGLGCRSYDIRSGKYTDCRGLDLFNEEAVRRLEAIYSDLARNDIDGVLFQDDLVLRHNEGFGPRASALFRKETGLALDPSKFYMISGDGAIHYTPLFWRWASWKNSRLLDIAARLRARAREKNPDIRFAINLMYESVTNPPYALAWLSQSLGEAVKRGFDYYSVMAYHRQMEEELGKDGYAIKGLIGRLARDALASVGNPNKVLIKLQTVDFTTGAPLSDDEVVWLIRDMKRIKGLSIAVVPYRRGFPFHELKGDGGGLALLD